MRKILKKTIFKPVLKRFNGNELDNYTKEIYQLAIKGFQLFPLFFEEFNIFENVEEFTKKFPEIESIKPDKNFIKLKDTDIFYNRFCSEQQIFFFTTEKDLPPFLFDFLEKIESYLILHHENNQDVESEENKGDTKISFEWNVTMNLHDPKDNILGPNVDFFKVESDKGQIGI